MFFMLFLESTPLTHHCKPLKLLTPAPDSQIVEENMKVWKLLR